MVRILAFYRSIKSKIAFYPTLFALSGLLFALLMMYLEKRGMSDYLVEHAPLFVVNSGDTALTILSACITGLISMMVFSFSMVMVLLNQAASDYSPRLLPGLISDYRHQIILGIYISSILYCIFVLFSIQPTGDKYQIPGFSVLLGILATVISIYAFIYFIHNISETIQITNIMEKIFNNASTRLNILLERETSMNWNFPDSHGWTAYSSDKSGYFQDFSGRDLLAFSKKNNTFLEVLPIKGTFVLKGTPVFRSKEKLSEEAVKELLENFHLSRKELVTSNYVLAFKQITEVVVKAMSPGINDPGTALNAIDYLSELIRLRMLKSDESFVSDSGQDYVKMRAVSFEELLYQINAALRKYCCGDIVVVQKLGYMYLALLKQKVLRPSYHDVLEKEAKRLLTDAKVAMTNEADLETLNLLAKKLPLQF
ncbi:DUF2254 domain-containing protein [Salegentibacter sp. F188]|uniref:DUF2254 domain-containing protein n=1 Tax=Autumnicola patrickiae TaxID=3075591 RepID=A0ABU3E228_9FLAO|nr:DUF2254 domain-containing protein [Salegentibacter sp. F188]MDT0689987.1 DUF2254 domain-containing protein [Salegentibacter sp. F188]